MKQLSVAIIIVLLLCACGNQPQSNSLALELSDTKIIKITPGTPHLIRADKTKIISMDELLGMIQSIDYIKLDSSEPMGPIDKIIVTKDKIFILDAHASQQIFVFDKTGKLLYRIKNRGRGPKEYLCVADMQVDTVRNEILVNDALACSYLYYSADDGVFLRREKGVANCYLTRYDSLYLNLTGIGQDFNDKENWEILVTDKDSVIYKGFDRTPLQDDIYVVNSFTYDCNGNLLFTPIYSDTVYQFTSASAVVPKYVICQEKSIWKRHDEKISWQEVNKLIKENNYTRYCGRFYDSANHAFFELKFKKFGDGISPVSCFWDKRSDLVYGWKPMDWDEYLIIPEIIPIPRTVYNDTFFGTISPRISEEYRKNLNPKIKSLLECSEESDNPILVLYTLK